MQASATTLKQDNWCISIRPGLKISFENRRQPLIFSLKSVEYWLLFFGLTYTHVIINILMNMLPNSVPINEFQVLEKKNIILRAHFKESIFEQSLFVDKVFFKVK